MEPSRDIRHGRNSALKTVSCTWTMNSLIELILTQNPKYNGWLDSYLYFINDYNLREELCTLQCGYFSLRRNYKKSDQIERSVCDLGPGDVSFSQGAPVGCPCLCLSILRLQQYTKWEYFKGSVKTIHKSAQARLTKNSLHFAEYCLIGDSPSSFVIIDNLRFLVASLENLIFLWYKRLAVYWK